MYERSYGDLYDKERTAKDVAAEIRRQIRAAVKAGDLPGDWRYSVRFQRYSGGRAIDVRATSPRPIYGADPTVSNRWGERVRHSETGDYVSAWVDRLTTEARRVRDLLDALHTAHNHNGSDSETDYFDVKYYGLVSLTTVVGVPEWDNTAT